MSRHRSRCTRALSPLGCRRHRARSVSFWVGTSCHLATATALRCSGSVVAGGTVGPRATNDRNPFGRRSAWRAGWRPCRSRRAALGGQLGLEANKLALDVVEGKGLPARRQRQAEQVGPERDRPWLSPAIDRRPPTGYRCSAGPRTRRGAADCPPPSLPPRGSGAQRAEDHVRIATHARGRHQTTHPGARPT